VEEHQRVMADHAVRLPLTAQLRLEHVVGEGDLDPAAS